MIESKSNREKAERLEKLLESERQVHEKNTQSLLREVKLKESVTEKKLKDVEEGLMNQILDLQRKLDDEKISRQEEISTIRAQHDAALESEDKKYQRRLTSLQERLNAKDTEYAQLLENENPASSDEKDEMIKSLNLELAKEKEQNAELLRESKSQKDSNTTDENIQLQELQSTCDSLEDELEKARTELNTLQEREKEHLEKIEQLSKEFKSTQRQSSQHKKRLDQSLSVHDAQIKELTEKFMSEAQRSQMTTQAQFQNLQSEHAEILRELREQHQTEKEVWEIEHKAALDEIRRDASFEKEEAIRAITKEWNDKNEDLHASMSKDAMEIQKHWETKLEEAKSNSLMKMSRLQGEMEVIKDRLGREIQRRKQNQTALADALKKLHALEGQVKTYLMNLTEQKKRITNLEKENSKIRKMQRTSERFARDILAITSPSCSLDANSNLPDILQAAVRHVSIMRIGQTSQGHQDTSFDLDTIPTYGF